VGEVLAGPVLVVKAVSPQAAFGHIVDRAFVGYPDLGLVLAVAQGELGAGKGREVLRHGGKNRGELLKEC
jgi:hypothetical protein